MKKRCLLSSKLIQGAIGALWLLLVSAGLLSMWNYDKVPGRPALATASWPANSAITSSQTDTLIVLIHPQCPCSRATISELGSLMAQCRNRLHTRVLFYRPVTALPGWEKTDLWYSAAAIPGVQVATDIDAREAKHFGAFTSGQVLLFNAHGQKLFSGGITIARGHAGDNAGSMAIISLVNTGVAPINHTPVYGCSLVGL